MEWIMLLLLASMVYWDFKDRRVWLWQLSVFGILQFAISFREYGMLQTVCHTLFNIAILLVISIVVFLYAYFRFRLKKALIGGGDIIFIVLLAPYFPYPFFVYFMLISFLCALAGWGVRMCLHRDVSATIPLISYLGVCYMVVIIYNSLLDL